MPGILSLRAHGLCTAVVTAPIARFLQQHVHALTHYVFARFLAGERKSFVLILSLEFPKSRME